MSTSAAIAYAERGYAVFPVHHMISDDCSCGKWNCAKGKHPRIAKWQNKATMDITTIKGWWSKWPDANIGIVTGQKSNLVVIDVDPRNGGDKSLQSLIDKYPKFKHAINTHEVSTGGNGFHYYFRYEKPFKSVKKHGLGRGIDIQADGRYIVAPPSNHSSGGRYSVVNDIDPQPLPQILIDLIGWQKTIETTVDEIKEGSRNIRLAELAGQALRDGKSPKEMKAYLQEINALHCNPALDFMEVDGIADSMVNGFDPKTSSVSLKTRWQTNIVESKQSLVFIGVCSTLALWMDKDGRNCFPTQEDIAERCGADIRTIRSNLKKAEELGFLKRYKHSKKGSKGFNYGYVAIVNN